MVTEHDTLLPNLQSAEPFYPTGDGEPVAETYDHLYALLIVLEVLRQFLVDRQATVLGNQFLYYAQGFPRLRTAPDVMVIFMSLPVDGTTTKSGKRDRCLWLSLR